MAVSPITPKVTALAASIYTDLVGNAVQVSPTGVKMTTDPANLAQLSFKLALIFEEVEVNLNADHLPKNQDFKVNVADIAEWSK